MTFNHYFRSYRYVCIDQIRLVGIANVASGHKFTRIKCFKLVSTIVLTLKTRGKKGPVVFGWKGNILRWKRSWPELSPNGRHFLSCAAAVVRSVWNPSRPFESSGNKTLSHRELLAQQPRTRRIVKSKRLGYSHPNEQKIIVLFSFERNTILGELYGLMNSVKTCFISFRSFAPNTFWPRSRSTRARIDGMSLKRFGSHWWDGQKHDRKRKAVVTEA